MIFSTSRINCYFFVDWSEHWAKLIRYGRSVPKLNQFVTKTLFVTKLKLSTMLACTSKENTEEAFRCKTFFPQPIWDFTKGFNEVPELTPTFLETLTIQYLPPSCVLHASAPQSYFTGCYGTYHLTKRNHLTWSSWTTTQIPLTNPPNSRQLCQDGFFKQFTQGDYGCSPPSLPTIGHSPLPPSS